MLQFVLNLFVALATGAYTGWFVARYLAFEDKREAVRAKIYDLPDLIQKVLEQKSESEARNRCMSLFITESSYYNSAGHTAAAKSLVIMGRCIERDLVNIWKNVAHLTMAGELDKLEKAMVDPVNETVRHANTCINELSPDPYILLFGKSGGRCVRGFIDRLMKLHRYLDGKAEDWK